jgi:hypothetical protein
VDRALVRAASHFGDLGWPEVLTDGGRGGTEGFDLYLVRGDHDHDARSDGPREVGPLDGVSVFATLDPTVPDAWLEACVAAAYGEALALFLDPAESPAWRRATAAYLAYVHTGRFGCDDGDVSLQQREPWRGWVEGAAGDGAGGAILLAALSERHGTRFVRDVWDLARQSTWEGEGLRGAPDLWMALDVALELSGEPLDDWLSELAIARVFGTGNDPGVAGNGNGNGIGRDPRRRPELPDDLADLGPTVTRSQKRERFAPPGGGGCPRCS